MKLILLELEEILTSATLQDVTQSTNKMKIGGDPASNPTTTYSGTLPEIPKEDPIPKELQSISCTDLFNMNKTNYDRLLLIDLRPEDQFENSRIKNFKCVNIPAKQLK